MSVHDVKYDSYIVTGYYHLSSKKFRSEYKDRWTAMCINLWKGRVWGKLNGKRTLLKTVR